MNTSGFRPRKPLRELLPDAADDAIDLLKRLLQFNPEKRPTADQILKHPFVRRLAATLTGAANEGSPCLLLYHCCACLRFHNPAEERVIGYDVVPPLSDDVQLTVEEYRSKLYEMIMQRKLERRRRRKGEEARRNEEESRPTTVASDHQPPAEPRVDSRSASHHHHHSHHTGPVNGKYSPGKNSPIAGRPPAAASGEGHHSSAPKKYTSHHKSGMLRTVHFESSITTFYETVHFSVLSSLLQHLVARLRAEALPTRRATASRRLPVGPSRSTSSDNEASRM